ncbi:alpha/beta fold hydrolase [Prauserella halophila]|uniref:alpha/beta fold hydrolase n=1 Tax=Prauserella halophila TaxID=185641 RepID=UPI0020A2C883|nr:alpha/beta hydrolase [Prauserella halophila]
MVDIGGRRLHIIRSGTGSPTVVVMPALSTPAAEWVRVQRALSRQTDATVVLVDRAGIGWSDPGPWPRSLSAMADELDALITALDLDDPVVLVGHSVGGLIARLFTARHPERVAHLVLSDSSHEDQNRRLREADPSVGDHELWAHAARWRLRALGWHRLRLALGGRPEIRQTARREVPPDLVDAHLALSLTGRHRRAVVQEFAGLLLGRKSMAAARDLGDLPITVITAGPHGREVWYPVWRDLQSEFLTMSHASRLIDTPHTGHHINHDDPTLHAQLIREAIDETRRRRTDRPGDKG